MNHKLNCNVDKCYLAATMRGFFQIPGSYFKKLMVVELEKGESVSEHEHKDHTVLLYPADSGPVIIRPVAGMMIYLPPGTPHSVPPVDGPRTSVAMIVEPE